jgi:putative ABC transport system permease protein
VSTVFREGARSTTGKASESARNVLVIAQVTLAFILLTAAGLLVRTFLQITSLNPGFRATNVLVLPVFLDMQKYGSGAKSRLYYKELIATLKDLPGVESVGGATALPASPLGPDFERPVWAEGTLPSENSKRLADVRMVTPDYFKTLGIGLQTGRYFTEGDTPDSRGVMMVNQKLADQIWPGEDPIGKRLVVDYSMSGTYAYEVVGVVSNIRFRGPKAEPRAEIYFPHAQRPYLVMNIAVRTKQDCRLMIASVRSVLLKIDPQKPPHSITPLGI